jgi:hypothetical protein
MTAKGGLGGTTLKLGVADRFVPVRTKAGGLKTAATKANRAARRKSEGVIALDRDLSACLEKLTKG